LAGLHPLKIGNNIGENDKNWLYIVHDTGGEKTRDALPETAYISSFCENRHANCPTIILLEIHHSLLFDVMIIFEKL
jgi:hypothetical protein